MLVEVRCDYERKPKNEYVELTNMTTKETNRIKNPNESWKTSLIVEVVEGTKADELINKVEKYLVEIKEAIKGTVRVNKLIKLEVIKL